MSDDTKLIPTSEPEDYNKLINDVRAIIDEGQRRVITTVNTELVSIYWLVGQRIVQEEQKGKERADYGEQLIVRLGYTLRKEFGRGFSEQNLRNMRQFYLTFPIRHTVSSELTWSHYLTLMRLPDDVQREFYKSLATSGRWSVRELRRQINSQLHIRTALSRNKEALAKTLPKGATSQPSTMVEAFKDPYILDFLGLEDTYSEKNLEAALIRDIEKFLLELGNGFCFVGRQQRITIGGEDYYIDLVLYHRYMRCLVLVDLKIGEFQPADEAQMNLYLQWMKENNRAPGEKEPRGLILCGAHDAQVVRLLEATRKQPHVKVAQYLALKDIEAIKAHLAKMADTVKQLEEGKKPEEK